MRNRRPGRVRRTVRQNWMDYRRGLIDGAEQLLELHLPSDKIIPDITVSEAMAAGVQALRERAIPLLGVENVFEELDGALKEQRPYSFIRLGDGELLTLAQEAVLPVSEIQTASSFLRYAGIVLPDFRARDELANSVRSASLVGVPVSRKPHFQPLLFQTLRVHGIACSDLKLTTSTMNYALHEHGYMQKLLGGRRLLVVGNVAGELAQALRSLGMVISGVISPVRGYSDVGRVVAEAAMREFDAAIVSAGVPAISIAVRIAELTGKVAIDFGHLADRIAGLEKPIGGDRHGGIPKHIATENPSTRGNNGAAKRQR